jgi:hypothetical protein
MMGGLARVEFVEGRPFFMTFFLNNKVVVHPTSHVGAEADEFIKKHAGTLLTPPFDPDRSVGTMVAHDIEVKVPSFPLSLFLSHVSVQSIKSYKHSMCLLLLLLLLLPPSLLIAPSIFLVFFSLFLGAR